MNNTHDKGNIVLARPSPQECCREGGEGWRQVLASLTGGSAGCTTLTVGVKGGGLTCGGKWAGPGGE